MTGNSSHLLILTIICPDTVGIIAAVSGFLSENQAFITESAQYGDPRTNLFFMRCVFSLEKAKIDKPEIEKRFGILAQKFKMKWQMHDASLPARVVMLVSKFGHCLNDLLHRYQTRTLPIEIPAVISNHETFREMVEWHKVPFHHLPQDKNSKAPQEKKLGALLKELNPDLIVLARYMLVLPAEICAAWPGKCINIHHSFLPSFKGAKPYHQAHEHGVKIIGATAHYVNEQLDEGPIIEQSVERVDHTFGPEQLTAVGRDIENNVLYRALKYHIEHRVLLNQNKTVVFK